MYGSLILFKMIRHSFSWLTINTHDLISSLCTLIMSSRLMYKMNAIDGFDSFIERANSAYDKLILSLSQGSDAAGILLGDDASASTLRGFLLGRQQREGASIHDFIVGRLQHDVGYSDILFKLNEKITKPFGQ